jgi:hypothetical protein
MDETNSGEGKAALFIVPASGAEAQEHIGLFYFPAN